MKIVIDTNTLVEEQEADALGGILVSFIEANGGHPYTGHAVPSKGWTVVDDTPRMLAVALMGDGVYEGLKPAHVRHDETGLEALWYVDGDLVLMFHMPSDIFEAGEMGFTIVNGHNGRGPHWSFDDLIDPRNDPAYVPKAFRN